MTEKRFRYEEHEVGFGVYEGNVPLDAITIVDLLNEQHETIQELKCKIELLENSIDMLKGEKEVFE